MSSQTNEEQENNIVPKKRVKKKKAQNYLKKPLSPYLLFCIEKRAQEKDKKFTAKELGNLWNRHTEQEKKPYYDNGSTLTPLPQEKNETKQPEKTNGYHRYYCEQQSVEKKCILAKNEIIALISYILLILMCIGDIIIQVCLKINVYK